MMSYPKRPEEQEGYELTSARTERARAAETFSEAFDYVIVFPMDENKQSAAAKYCLHAMLDAGMEVYPYLSVQEDELYVLFRCPTGANGRNVLAEYADRIDYKLPADAQNVKLALEEDGPEGSAIMEKRNLLRINPKKITHMPEVCCYNPWQHMYFKYDTDEEFQRLYAGEMGTDGNFTPFTKDVRLKLTYLMLNGLKSKGGCGLEIQKLIHKKKILAMFPLHSPESEELLTKAWLWSTFPWDYDMNGIRDYFGEKIALFFVFVAHYSYWLVGPAIVGIAFQIVVWATNDYSHPILPFFGVFITVWSVFMLEYWKRAESTIALSWGMTDFEETEEERPEFKGDEINSFIDGRKMLYFHPSIQQQRETLSSTVVTTFIMLVIGVVAAIYVLRFSLQPDIGSQASTVASVLNTVQITVINMIYQEVAVKLTDKENHRTDTQYEDAMITKLFVFQFINSYSSFFFLAFIAGNLERPDDVPDTNVGQCGSSTCMQPLMVNLGIIFGTRLTVGNFLDVFVPYIMKKLKHRTETKGVAEGVELTPAEKDYLLMQYVPIIESIRNYADVAIQYGYSMLFITALPIACFGSLINNYFKVKFVTWKLCKFFQRPIPTSAQDIGTWQAIFTIISVIAVITNGALICFTMDVLYAFSLQGRVWIFLGFQWVLISCQFFATLAVDDVPQDVEIQIQRNKFISSVLIDHVPDEDYLDDKAARLASGPAAVEETRVEVAECGKCYCDDDQIGGKEKVKKMDGAENLTPIPQYEYPFTAVPSAFPKPYSTGGVLPEPPNQTTTTKENLPGFMGAAVMPPPPPSYN